MACLGASLPEGKVRSGLPYLGGELLPPAGEKGGKRKGLAALSGKGTFPACGSQVAPRADAASRAWRSAHPLHS